MSRPYELLQEISQELYLISDIKGRLLDLSPLWEELMFYPIEHLIQDSLESWFSAKGWKKFNSLLEQLTEGNSLKHHRLEFLSSKEDTISLRCNLARSADKLILTAFPMNTASKSHFHSLPDVTLAADCSDAMIRVDSKFNVLEWSTNCSRVFGFTAVEVLGQDLGQLILPEDIHESEFLFHQVVQTRQIMRLSNTFRKHKDGHLIEVSVSAIPLFDVEGDSDGAIFIFSDQTENSQRRRSLSQNQYLAELGQSTLEIGHEIKNPISIIEGLSQICLKKINQPNTDLNELKKKIKKTREVALRVAKVVDSIRELSQSGKIAPKEWVTLASIVETVFEVLQSVARQNKVKITLGDNLSQIKIYCHRIQLVQACMNLIRNSIEAIQKTADSGWIQVEAAQSGAMILLFITDSGEGFSEDIVKKLGRPFVRESGAPDGRGLGLSIVNKIVRQHGGQLSVDQGSTHSKVTIELPQYTRKSDLFKFRKILVVEDEPEIRNLIANGLRESHAQVVALGSAEEALECVKTIQFDVFVLDIKLPKMTGLDLALHLRAEVDSDSPIIFVSAYIGEEIQKAIQLIDESKYLAKPFNLEHLVKII